MPVWSRWPWSVEAAIALGAAVTVVAVSSTHGGYFPREWGWLLLALLPVALLALLIRDRLKLSSYELAAIGLWAAYAGWTALSTVWSGSAAQPVLATERTLVYAAAVPAVLLLVRVRSRGLPVVAGVILGATAVSGYALVTRLLPGWVAHYPPPDGYQLQAPIGYWNGLAILAVMGALAAGGVAAEANTRAARACAAAVLPTLGLCLYFTFSRGGLLAAAAGACVAVAVSRRRLHLLAVFALLAPTVAGVVWYASGFPALTRAGSSLAEARVAGRHVGIVLLLCTVLAAGIGWLLQTVELRVRVGARTRRLIGAALLGAVLAAGLAGLVHAGGPRGVSSRLSTSFNRSLPATGGDLNRRLTSFSSDGRADYWRVAWTEARAHPWSGGGAGSYERYWLRYRPTAFEAQNAHNLYLETLAELGPLGLALLLAAFAVPFLAAMRNRAGPGVTAAAGAFGAYVVHAAIDWDFQIPAVTLPALFCAAALCGAARRHRETKPMPAGVRLSAAVGLVALIVVAVGMQVGNSSLANATAALDRGDVARAWQLADRARRWQPWSYEPWQLRGEARLAEGRPAAARADFEHGLARDRTNWSLWYDLAQATRGAARTHALQTARRLNPRAVELASARAT
ncbi:MAG: O-antigen ligase family protein [Gaiellaceae bacterium]